MSFTVPKLQIVCVLPYADKSSLDLRARLRGTAEKNTPFCNLNVVFRFTCRLGNSFRFKDSIEKKYLSGIVYRYTCSNCKVTYYKKRCQNYYKFFLPERFSTWKVRIKQGNVLETLKSWQYLTTCCNLTHV